MSTQAWISYARASTEEQTTSCPQQHADNARAAGSPAAGSFDDEGVRGSVPVERRPGFARMLAVLRAANPGTYAVRFYDTSRLGRFLNADEDHSAAERLLKVAGAASIVYTKGSYTPGRSLQASVMRAVEAHQNLDYSEKLSRDVHRGVIAAVREGKRSGGFAPFGYDLEYPDQSGAPYARVRFVPVGGRRRAFEKHVTYLEGGRTRVIPADQVFRPETKHRRSKLVLGDPKRIEAVKLIFREYLGGKGLRTVVHQLTDEGYPSPEANGWSISGVRSILINPVYTGSAVYGRRSESKYHQLTPGGVVSKLEEGEQPGKKALRLADRNRWIIVENAHEALIDAGTWLAANQRREGRSQSDGGRTRAREPYLLSGLLFCPRCGYRYVGIPARRKAGGKVYETRYYVCGNYQRGGACQRGAVEKLEAERKVLDMVSRKLHADVPEAELRDRIKAKLVAAVGGDKGARPDGRAEELVVVERRLRAIAEQIDPENLEFLNDQLTRLRKKRDELRASLAEIADVPPADVFDVDRAVEEVLDLTRRFRELAGSKAPEHLLALREQVLPRVLPGGLEAHAEEGYLLARPATANCVNSDGRGEPIRTNPHNFRRRVFGREILDRTGVRGRRAHGSARQPAPGPP